MGSRIKGSALAWGFLALLALGGLSTSPAAAAAACPNEALRTGLSASLPECRAYEMVSPSDKGDGYVLTFYGTKAAPDGSGIAYLSTSTLASSGGSPLFVVDVARREGATGWDSTGIDPPFLNADSLSEVATPAVSEDLGKALQVSGRALAPGAIEGGSNLYVRDQATGARTLVRAEAGQEITQYFAVFSGQPYVGGSPDWSHLVLRSVPPLAEGVPAGVSNIYDFTDGHVEVVDRLPDGEIPAQGASAVGEGARRGVSRDGRRVYFWRGNEGEGPLYLREDDARTLPISVSRKKGPEKGEVMPAAFEDASADGSVVYFTSLFELTGGAHQGDLYRYEPAGEKLTDLTASAGYPTEFIGASEDGSYVYFSNQAALSGEAGEAAEGETNVYLWHSGAIGLIARVSSVGGTGFRQPQVSPNGEHLGFVSSEPLTADDVPTSACPASPVAEHCAQVFDYEAADGALACVTCEGPAAGDSELGTLGEVYLLLGGNSSRAVLDDGSVIVDTPNRLVPRDSNGLEDVYLWRGGAISLISSGTNEGPSNFADASPDGSDIFFRTGQRLVGIDTDSTTDIYDARVDGGIAAQNPPGAPRPCEGEVCRGPSPALPARPGTAVTAEPKPACARFGRSAAAHAAAASRLGARASHAAGAKARRLRATARRQRAKAKHLRSRAGLCRRAGA